MIARCTRLGALCALAFGSLACKADAPAPMSEPVADASQNELANASANESGASGLAGETVAPDTLAQAATKPDGGDAGDAGEPAVDAALDPEPEPEPAVPTEPQTVLILGDSLAATGFGALLEKKLDLHPLIVCHRKGKSASGLARPDYFDWIAEAKRQVELRSPDLVVVIMGGNDGQDLTRRSRGDGKRVAWKDEAWPDAYRERMDQFLHELQSPGRKIVWLGLPQMGLSSFERKLTIIRDVQQNAVEALGDGAVYVDTIPFVTDENGNLLESAKVGRRQEALRAEDKIHFTMPGSEYFADRVYPHVLQALGLPIEENG